MRIDFDSFKWIGNYPILSREEEMNLIIRVKDGCSISRDKLVMHNTRFVLKMAWKYSGYGVSIEDLVQEGCIGLMKAIDRYDLNIGVRLLTYASYWVRAFIMNHIMKMFCQVKRFTTQERKADFVKNSHKYFYFKELSLDMPVDDFNSTLLDALENDYTPEDNVIQADLDMNIRREVINSIENDKERKIVINRILSDEPDKLRIIGRDLNLCRERIRQIESNLMRRISKKIKKIA